MDTHGSVNWSSLVQLMACRLFSPNLLLEPINADSLSVGKMKYEWEYQTFLPEDAFKISVCSDLGVMTLRGARVHFSRDELNLTLRDIIWASNVVHSSVIFDIQAHFHSRRLLMYGPYQTSCSNRISSELVVGLYVSSRRGHTSCWMLFICVASAPGTIRYSCWNGILRKKWHYLLHYFGFIRYIDLWWFMIYGVCTA